MGDEMTLIQCRLINNLAIANVGKHRIFISIYVGSISVKFSKLMCSRKYLVLPLFQFSIYSDRGQGYSKQRNRLTHCFGTVLQYNQTYKWTKLARHETWEETVLKVRIFLLPKNNYLPVCLVLGIINSVSHEGPDLNPMGIFLLTLTQRLGIITCIPLALYMIQYNAQQIKYLHLF